MLAYLYGATDAPDVLEYCISKVGPDFLLIPSHSGFASESLSPLLDPPQSRDL
jgi:hypothetical protein